MNCSSLQEKLTTSRLPWPFPCRIIMSWNHFDLVLLRFIRAYKRSSLLRAYHSSFHSTESSLFCTASLWWSLRDKFSTSFWSNLLRTHFYVASRHCVSPTCAVDLTNQAITINYKSCIKCDKATFLFNFELCWLCSNQIVENLKNCRRIGDQRRNNSINFSLSFPSVVSHLLDCLIYCLICEVAYPLTRAFDIQHTRISDIFRIVVFLNCYRML